MDKSNQFIGACGIDCSTCDIFEASSEPAIARKIADWFKTTMNQEIKPEDIFCEGCKGDRNRHWSADCWILKCCVDTKGLEHCNQCDEFLCDRLEKWALTDVGYMSALEYLKGLNNN